MITQLTDELARTTARVEKLSADLAALTVARRSESDDDEHDPEGETLSSQWSMLAGLLQSARQDLTQVEKAISRVESGTYGICLQCGRPIPEEQLEVRPARETCVKC